MPVGAPLGRQFVQPVVDGLQVGLAGSRRHVRAQTLVECEEPHRVVLSRCHQREGRGEIGTVTEFGGCAVALLAERVHGRAGVEQNQQTCIGLAFEQFQKRSVGAGVGVPIDETRVVAGNVVPVFRELLAKARAVRVVGTVQDTVDHGAGNEFQGTKLGEYCGWNHPRRAAAAGRGRAAALGPGLAHAAAFSSGESRSARSRASNALVPGSGTLRVNSAMTSSTEISSDSAR